MTLSKQDIQTIYQRQAKKYDFAVKLYPLIGLRIAAYRVRAVQLLRLQRGDCVVDLGCGTGLNFPLLVEQIGPEGRVIGVDFSSGMLSRARQRSERAGWKQVELVQADITAYNFPHGVNGVLSTGVFGYVTEYERVIEAAAQALTPGGRLVIVDSKQPGHWPGWLFQGFMWLSRSFGLTPEYFKGRPWEAVNQFFQETALEERYWGAVYISSGTAPSLAR